jgi:hypothetical protein
MVKNSIIPRWLKMNEAASAEAVMRKALDILKSELSKEEYLTYLETIVPKIGDATKELRGKTRGLALRTVLKEARKFQAGQA